MLSKERAAMQGTLKSAVDELITGPLNTNSFLLPLGEKGEKNSVECSNM